MPKPFHVLFVCTGNTCRSPMAQAILQHLVAERDDFLASSAGIAASSQSSANPQTLNVLKKKNIQLDSFTSQPVTAELLENCTHVVTMTKQHLDYLESVFPQHSDKFYQFGEFVDIEHNGRVSDIPDPIGMGSQAYEQVAQIFEAGMPALIAYIDHNY
jgi:protein-tyrosine-phosphatase